ncbi:MAG: hypothetical protein QW051_04625 [Candidatus Aenigmatarchaeota archaeon]
MVKIYTDGSYKKGIIVYGFLIIQNGVEVALRARATRTSTDLKNVEAEVLAVIDALEELQKMYGNLKGERVILAYDLSSMKDILLGSKTQEQDENSEKENEESLDVATKQNNKNKKFFEYVQNKFKNLKNNLQCEISFEKVRGHSHEIHNKVDRLLSIILEHRLRLQEQIKKQEVNINKITPQNSIPTMKVSNSLYSKYEYDYMGFIIKRLSRSEKPLSYEEIETITIEANNKFLSENSNFRRTLKNLLKEMAQNGYISEPQLGFYEYKPVKLVYTENEIFKQTKKEKKKEISEYVLNYINFISNYIRKVGNFVSYQEILEYATSRKNEWLPQKFDNFSLEDLLEFMVSNKKLIKNSEGNYFINENLQENQQSDKKEPNQYEEDYKIYLVNIIKGFGIPLSVSEIKKKTKNNPYRINKTERKLTLEKLLDELVSQGKIQKVGNTYCMQNTTFGSNLKIVL